MKNRSVWFNILLGLWLMLSPFALVLLNNRVLGVVWEDLLLGFGIATFSFCRLLSRRKGRIVFADWLVTAFGLLTLINPILYSYANFTYAKWNNLAVGALVLGLAFYQDWKDDAKILQ